MVPPSMAKHPEVLALEASLRQKYANELNNPATADRAEKKIIAEVMDLEMSLLMKLPTQGEVLW